MAVKQMRRNSEQGLATLEALTILIIFVVLIGFSLGSFGIVHTGILNSIAGRTYAFETFRHRTNLTYFRENRAAATTHFRKAGVRFHAIQSDLHNTRRFPTDRNLYATERLIAMGLPVGETIRNRESQSGPRRDLSSIQPSRRTNLELNPVWIRIGYGMCLDLKCGDQ